MLMQTATAESRSAHVVVFGNEKGGSGKSTTAMHVAVALMRSGQRVATIDLDSRQQSLTHYLENRRDWAQRGHLRLAVPEHFCIARAEGDRLEENDALEFEAFAEAITSLERSHDFIIIDTPGADTYLMRLAHAMADTLVTPLNDSFVDFDVLGSVDPETFAVTGVGHYGEIVREARRQRRLVDGVLTDWVVMRNRLSTMASRNKQLIGEGLAELGRHLGFRSADGFPERLVFREFFPRGLTALDDIEEATLGTRPNMSHVSAREEVTQFLRALKLPVDERGRRRAGARAEWAAAADRPIEVPEVVTD